jgi:hypothetical protein
MPAEGSADAGLVDTLPEDAGGEGAFLRQRVRSARAVVGERLGAGTVVIAESS